MHPCPMICCLFLTSHTEYFKVLYRLPMHSCCYMNRVQYMYAVGVAAIPSGDHRPLLLRLYDATL